MRDKGNMDSSQEPRIRIQRSVSVTLGTTRPGSSSSHHHYHHLRGGGRPRTSSSASMPSAVVGSGGGGGGKMGRQRSLSQGKPSQPLMDNDIYGRNTVAVTTTTTTTAPRRTESAVPPSLGGPVLPRPKTHDARVRMIVKQQREVQEIRDLADFLRNRTPPPGNFMSRPDDAISARSASPEPPESRSQLARRWCALKSVFALRRRKAHKDEQKRRSRRASAEMTAATATAPAPAPPWSNPSKRGQRRPTSSFPLRVRWFH
ncbi:hypothetical protein MAPG_02234 [Magnaporthiopsis poae ATCC 64411]|uniref:Uncharacterized protein n=1 Tax=Magnaporthiopsis poae (strain ATCC 64411 / 73-15) TaxID=644358 RepID=A0A0C4DQT7_MAGP6|nr:hypothetical protein MAPG_02234 [Magnaporthiopsis poae ATCC 64411]